MRSLLVTSLAAALLAACADPVVDQAKVDTRHDAVRADTMLAIDFRPGTGQLDPGQVGELRAMVAEGQRAQRDEFLVVTDGSGGPIQTARADRVRQSLSAAGARWVGAAVEPAMAMGPDQVVVVRSEYRIGTHGCPDSNPAGIGNTDESQMGGYGCADAYNMGQMLARPRDAAVGRPGGPADGTVSAAAIQRYHEGKVRTSVAGATSAGGDSSGGGAGGASSVSLSPVSTN
jgi:type IV pilus biogenesis protein CpaD/CtpE